MPGFLELGLPAAYILAGLSGCPAAPPPEVVVELHASDPPLDASMTHAELTAGFANNPDSSLSTEPGWHIGGLTLSNVQASTSVRFQQLTSSDNTGCFWISRINFDIVYNPVIFVASDYMDDKCRYTLTLAHEERHVGTDLKTFNDYTPAIRKALQSVAAGYGAMGPYRAASLSQRQDAVLEHINAAAQPIIDELYAARQERQARFDTTSNYEYESSLCNGGRR